MEVVKMIASVAGEEVFMGECHPARARVLVKKQLASWKDGKLLLHILGVHDALLTNNPESARGPLDDENVSKQEMERRFAWFRNFMVKSTKVFAKMARSLPSLEDARAWAEAEKEKAEASSTDQTSAVFGHPIGTIPSFRFGYRGSKLLLYRTPEPEVVLTDAEAEAYFEKESAEIIERFVSSRDTRDQERDLVELAADGFIAEHGLSAIWETAPDMSRVFRVPVLPAGPDITEAEYEKLRERDRMLLRKEYGRKDYVESPPTVVAELVQVRCLWSQADY